jgi:hypothetical protein
VEGAWIRAFAATCGVVGTSKQNVALSLRKGALLVAIIFAEPFMAIIKGAKVVKTRTIISVSAVRDREVVQGVRGARLEVIWVHSGRFGIIHREFLGRGSGLNGALIPESELAC